MALTDYQIRDGDITTYGIVAEPDILTGTVSENKRVFDRLVREVVKPKLNGLITELVLRLAEKYEKPSGGIPDSDLAAAHYTETEADLLLAAKLDRAQGAAHAGEFLVVGADGGITTQALAVWQGGSY